MCARDEDLPIVFDSKDDFRQPDRGHNDGVMEVSRDSSEEHQNSCKAAGTQAHLLKAV
jgi:hypothetical protein